jgi:thiol-disulfide isomerase/thioredoxin
MSVRRSLIVVGLCLLLASFAAPAQKRKRGAARPAQSVASHVSPVVSEINTEALKGLLGQQKQKPLLVNFWATWCDPCREEFPDLVKIDAEYRPGSLDFVTVSLDDVQDIKTEVPKFLVSMKAWMPAYLLNVPDPEPAINAVDPKWQGDLPATFLYNVKGEVAYKHFGRVNAAELRAAIEKVISDK